MRNCLERKENRRFTADRFKKNNTSDSLQFPISKSAITSFTSSKASASLSAFRESLSISSKENIWQFNTPATIVCTFQSIRSIFYLAIVAPENQLPGFLAWVVPNGNPPNGK